MHILHLLLSELKEEFVHSRNGEERGAWFIHLHPAGDYSAILCHTPGKSVDRSLVAALMRIAA